MSPDPHDLLLIADRLRRLRRSPWQTIDRLQLTARDTAEGSGTSTEEELWIETSTILRVVFVGARLITVAEERSW
jgi:hypothetical protein